MIPEPFITAWSNQVPWPEPAQVEQDLVLSRALVAIFSNPFLNQALAFRGGTALHKLFFTQSQRYSEDIDLCRTTTGPVGPIIDSLRAVLDTWLGRGQFERTDFAVRLNYRFWTETEPRKRMKVKVEINVRETINVYGPRAIPFSVTNPWFTGNAQINTFSIEELLGTKLRALYQREKGRDLYDLFLALTWIDDLDVDRIITAFKTYLQRQNLTITRANFETNLDGKLGKTRFLSDMRPLLPVTAQAFDIPLAYAIVSEELVSRLD